MTKRIFRSVFSVSVAVLAASFAIIMGVLYSFFDELQTTQLKNELTLAAKAAEISGEAYFEDLQTKDCRITLIANDGTVLYDTQNNPDTMENHSDREEFIEAVKNGEGESSRYSSTLLEETTYFAEKLADGNVIRISSSRASVLYILLGMMQPVIVVAVIALVLSVILAHSISKKIVEPLNHINLDEPLENNVYDEISPLLTHIEHQQRKIRSQREDLEKSKKDFYAVIENMNEGLVLLDNKGIVISINPAAAKFFSSDKACIGKDFLFIERGQEIQELIKNTSADGFGEIQLRRNNREYQLRTSRIDSQNSTSGIVILIFDITEKFFAERNRKEFTANVSHELKTPLQAIMGSTELLDSGMVKKEDMPRFVGHIKNESKRLLALIEDIIRLSRLDEKNEMPETQIELLSFAESELNALAPAAEKRNISLICEGNTVKICSVHQLMHEIIYNLCDNAIKYNKDGGTVKITIRNDGDNAVIKVSDTGIGIPSEHHDRIFERFYRVDKSHSKESGGTGLGLSIVKHSVQYLGGSISLESETGKGTDITVMIPIYSIRQNAQKS